MAPSTKRPVGSGVIGFGVILLVVLVWYVGSGNAGDGPSGNDVRLAVPDSEATPGPGDSTGLPEVTDERNVPLEGYELLDGTRVQLTYFAGPADCFGELATPRVLESDGSVIVSLRREPPATPTAADGDCTADLPRTLTVALGAPLGGRGVLDGAYAPPVRVAPLD